MEKKWQTVPSKRCDKSLGGVYMTEKNMTKMIPLDLTLQKKITLLLYIWAKC